MVDRPRFSIARAVAVACFLGATLGVIGRLGRSGGWHVFVEGFGCCGASCHCYHGVAVVGLSLYVSGMVAVLLGIGETHRRLQGYGAVSLLALLYTMALPVIQVGKNVDPRGMCMIGLFVSGVVFLGVGTCLRLLRGGHRPDRPSGPRATPTA